MSRWIEAENAMFLMLCCGTYHGVIAFDTVKSVINDMPSIDIVRCRECKWSKANGTYQWCGRLDSTAKITDDDFCSYGCKVSEIPTGSEKPNNCDTCLYRTIPWDAPICDSCTTANSHYEKDEFEPKTCVNRECENYDTINDHCMFIEQCHYKPKTEPSRVQIVPKMEMVTDCHRLDEPLTDAEITELAKAIVHKMIDNGNIAEDAYPDLRQRMHEAVERLDEYYPSEDERSSE